MISTRGRYALRVMVDIAQNSNGEYIPMKDVAARQGISLKYLEQILPALTKNKLVEAVHGKGGGYKLTRKPSEYKVGEILRLTENSLAAVACLQDGGECDRQDICPTREFWKGLDDVVNAYLDSQTLEQLM